MIYELAPGDYARVRALVAGLAYHLSIQAVIDGTVAGRIWVDDVLAPTVAFVLTPEGQYLAGASANPAFNQALGELLLPWSGVGLTYSPDTWEPTFAALLAGKFARKYPRRYYTFRRFLLPDWRDRVPPGYELARVGPQLLARQDLVGLDEVRERIADWTDFARDGFGFCLVHGRTIASHCIADCVSGGACEVGVATHDDYRRRGLGTLTVAAAVEYCLEHGLPTIGWHCLANNRGSQRVAENVGFALVGDYAQYANYGVAENRDDLARAEWQAQAVFFEHAFEILSRHGAMMAWRAAQARAVAGEHAEAFALLRRAIDSGGLPPQWEDWLQEGWQFHGLRTEPDWTALLAHAHAARSTEPGEGEG